MVEQLLNAYRFGFQYAQRLVEDIPREAVQLSGGKGLENSPLFTIGHLVTGAGLTAASFHGENTVDQAIRNSFERKGPNDQRSPDLESNSLTIDELMEELYRQHELVENGIVSCSTEQWATSRQWRLGNYFPTFADATWFMCVTHEALHLGQLAAWRRWYGLPSAMAKM